MEWVTISGCQLRADMQMPYGIETTRNTLYLTCSHARLILYGGKNDTSCSFLHWKLLLFFSAPGLHSKTFNVLYCSTLIFRLCFQNSPPIAYSPSSRNFTFEVPWLAGTGCTWHSLPQQGSGNQQNPKQGKWKHCSRAAPAGKLSWSHCTPLANSPYSNGEMSSHTTKSLLFFWATHLTISAAPTTWTMLCG